MSIQSQPNKSINPASIEESKVFGVELRAQYKDIKLICGLGNPGKKYDKTWHNLGRQYCESLLKLAEDSQIETSSTSFSGHTIYTLGPSKLKILLLDSFMNLSGREIAKVSNYFKLQKNELLLAYDDLDLDFPAFKISFANSPRIHNGVNSTITALGGNEFWQIRIGANTLLKQNFSVRADYLLSIIPTTEALQLPVLFNQINDSLFSTTLKTTSNQSISSR